MTTNWFWLVYIPGFLKPPETLSGGFFVDHVSHQALGASPFGTLYQVQVGNKTDVDVSAFDPVLGQFQTKTVNTGMGSDQQNPIQVSLSRA